MTLPMTRAKTARMATARVAMTMEMPTRMRTRMPRTPRVVRAMTLVRFPSPPSVRRRASRRSMPMRVTRVTVIRMATTPPRKAATAAAKPKANRMTGPATSGRT